MSWLLDTDVLSQPAKKNGNPQVIAWLKAEKDHCYTSAIVIAQLSYWVKTKEGRQRTILQTWLKGGFHPPQSYRYVGSEELGKLMD